MNTFNFLSIVWQNLLNETRKNPVFLVLVLMLSTISLPLGVSNVLLGIYILVVFITFKKENLNINLSNLIPIALFLWAVLSLFWTVDFKESVSVTRQITLLIIPVLFCLQPTFSQNETHKILNYFSWSMVGFALFYLVKATVRFILTKDVNVFFYHELVTLKVNAIYVSFFFTMAFLNFYRAKLKTWKTKAGMLILLVLIVLLSSKNILLVLLFLVVVYHLFFSLRKKRTLFLILGFISLGIMLLFSIKQVRDRFLTEFQHENIQIQSSEINNLAENGVRIIRIREAWQQEVFTQNDFFSGTAFRVYQIRVFKELLQEEPIFWLGFGFNASGEKVQEKSIEHNVFQGNETQFGYGSLNFHNQYVQYFAELGIVGFILILLFVGINLKNAIQKQDFLHFAFAILCISLFLTECLFWRQHGVVFVILFYCLFNQKKLENHQQSKQ